MPYYSHTSGAPAAASRGTSSNLRAEFDLIQSGFTSAYNDIQTLAAAIGAGTSSVESPIASATTTTIGSAGGNIISITGTNTISSFGSVYNGAKYVRFTGSLTLLASATLVTPSGTNIVTQAGDSCIVVPIGNPATGWRIASYERMSQAMLSDDAVRKSTATLQTITGALTVGGAMIAASFAGPLNGSVGATTPSTGSFTTLNSTGGALNGSVGATTPSTGAFTTLSAISSGDVATFGSTGKKLYIAPDSSGTSLFSGAGQTGSGVYIDSTNNLVKHYVSGSPITSTSSTGLAVTGALSATGTATFNELQLTGATTSGFGGEIALKNAGAIRWRNATNTGNLAGITVDASNNLVLGGIGATADTIFSNAGIGETMRLSSGNLGIGVTPSAWATYKALQIGTGSLSNDSGYSTELSTNTYYNAGFKYINTQAAARYAVTNGNHIWFTAPSGTAGTAITFTQAMTLDASGNLGLGVTPSAWQSGTNAIEANGVSIWARGTNGGEFVTNAYFNGTNWIYKANAAASRYIQQLGIHAWQTASSGTSGGTITFTQSLAVGKGTSLALEGATSAAGTGIEFPATQLASSSANCLDDYREGTWTPTQGAGLTVVGTFSFADAVYTKIGRQVTVSAKLTGSTSIAVSAGGVLCNGLPFTPAAGSYIGSAINSTMSTSASVAIAGSAMYSTAISATPNIQITCTFFV